MRAPILAVILALLCTSAIAAEVSVDRIEVVGKGIYQVQTGQVTKDPNLPAGQIKAPDTFKLITATSTIPAQIGVEFGIEYRVAGAPAGAEVTLHMVNTYPDQGLADPASAKPILSDKYERTKKIGDVNYVGYGFENDWELVPGTWTMEIWYGDRKLLDEKFTVVK